MLSVVHALFVVQSYLADKHTDRLLEAVGEA